jgi:hypothetical protein
MPNIVDVQWAVEVEVVGKEQEGGSHMEVVVDALR